MEKKLSKEIMETVQSAYDNGNIPDRKWKRVKKCQAYYTGEGDVKVLRSYHTIVALYDYRDNLLTSYGRYSMTTYQHIRKFREVIAQDRGIAPWNIEEVNLELVNKFEERRG